MRGPIAKLAVLAAYWAFFPAYADPNLLPPQFNKQRFAGLIGNPTASGFETEIHVEFKVDSGVRIFRSCREVETTDSAAISGADSAAFQLLRLDCTALRLFSEMKPSRTTAFPSSLTPALIRELPSDAVPAGSVENLSSIPVETLEKFLKPQRVKLTSRGTVEVSNREESITYALLGRGDFNGDGEEDLIVRASWSARGAVGVGHDLFIVSRSRSDRPIKVLWRPPSQRGPVSGQ